VFGLEDEFGEIDLSEFEKKRRWSCDCFDYGKDDVIWINLIWKFVYDVMSMIY